MLLGVQKFLSDISTHALTEGDQHINDMYQYQQNFNSRPHGGRPLRTRLLLAIWSFQLTPSRRATANLDKFFF